MEYKYKVTKLSIVIYHTECDRRSEVSTQQVWHNAQKIRTFPKFYTMSIKKIAGTFIAMNRTTLSCVNVISYRSMPNEFH